MYIDLILWDDADDPQGNVQHIVGPGEVTPEEVEEVLYDHEGPVDSSDSSGRPIGLRLDVHRQAHRRRLHLRGRSRFDHRQADHGLPGPGIWRRRLRSWRPSRLASREGQN